MYTPGRLALLREFLYFDVPVHPLELRGRLVFGKLSQPCLLHASNVSLERVHFRSCELCCVEKKMPAPDLLEATLQ